MSGAGAIERVYLASYLAPLDDLLARDDITDIHINRPGEAWLETLAGSTEVRTIPALDEATLLRLVRQVAAYSSQGVSREHPILSAALPDGSRVQVVIPPATRGEIAISIRKHVSPELSLDDYMAQGAFAETAVRPRDDQDRVARVQTLLDLGDIAGALRQAVRSRMNILVSGGTSTGKTTFLNALTKAIPDDERLIFIEDTPELQIARPNAIGLLAARSKLGEASVDADDLVAASLRMRPDRILIGELRGREALAFLRAVNTGHPGSMTTVHADSAASAVEQLTLLVLQTGTTLSRQDVRAYIAGTIDVFVQLNRIAGKRVVSEIALGPFRE